MELEWNDRHDTLVAREAGHQVTVTVRDRDGPDGWDGYLVSDDTGTYTLTTYDAGEAEQHAEWIARRALQDRR